MISENPDEQLLGTVARALVAIEDLRYLTMFQMPYPPRVQRAMDQFVLHCLRKGATPPTCVPALIRWGYERPLDSWTLTLPAGIYPTDGLLIDENSGAPTVLCHEIALCSMTGNPLQDAAHLMTSIAELAADRNQAQTFQTLRRLLAEHPALTNEQLNTMRFAHRLGSLDEYLGDFYRQIGPEYAHDGEVCPCAHCGIPLRRIDEDTWWCEQEECAAAGATSPGQPLDWDAEVSILLDRRHRQFVSGPDRAVLRIVESLRLSGVTAESWPEPGIVDLRVPMPSAPAWTAVVVDWHSPALLGRAIAAAIEHESTSIAVWVVAQYRVDTDPHYLAVLREHAVGAAGIPQVYSEEEFIRMVCGRHKENGHA